MRIKIPDFIQIPELIQIPDLDSEKIINLEPSKIDEIQINYQYNQFNDSQSK